MPSKSSEVKSKKFHNLQQYRDFYFKEDDAIAKTKNGSRYYKIGANLARTACVRALQSAPENKAALTGM